MTRRAAGEVAYVVAAAAIPWLLLGLARVAGIIIQPSDWTVTEVLSGGMGFAALVGVFAGYRA